MNEIYTVEELALCRDKESLVAECVERIEGRDIVISSKSNSSLDLIIDELGAEFKREIASYVLNSFESGLAKAREKLLECVNSDAKRIASEVERPF